MSLHFKLPIISHVIPLKSTSENCPQIPFHAVVEQFEAGKHSSAHLQGVLKPSHVLIKIDTFKQYRKVNAQL